MPKKVKVEGYEAVKSALKEYGVGSNSVFVLFSGSKDERGVSWCPDCAAAEPVIEKSLQNAPEDSVFIYCSVGNRSYWKNLDNEFRKDEHLKLTCVPTLIKWKTAQRLEEEQCSNESLVSLFFEE